MHDPAILNDLSSYTTDTCLAIVIASLVTIARKWELPKYAFTDEWVRKMWSIYTMEYYPAEKKNESMHLQINGWN